MRRTEYLAKACDPKTLTAGQLMEDAVITCGPGSTGMTIAQLLSERNVGSVPVVEEDRTLVGLVSEFDLLKAMSKAMQEGKDLRAVTAADIMVRDVVTVRESTSVVDLVALLQERHLIRVPVVRDKILVGIVARRDIVYAYVKALAYYWP
jgi:CBS domain-containing protein